MKNQSVAFCLSTISTRFKRLAHQDDAEHGERERDLVETSWAQVRIEPRIEYFESDAQPPTMKP
jgi:hypothetical protein